MNFLAKPTCHSIKRFHRYSSLVDKGLSPANAMRLALGFGMLHWSLCMLDSVIPNRQQSKLFVEYGLEKILSDLCAENSKANPLANMKEI